MIFTDNYKTYRLQKAVELAMIKLDLLFYPLQSTTTQICFSWCSGPSCCMTVLHLNCLPNVNAVIASMLSMHFPVQKVAFHLSDTMRSKTSPPLYSQKCEVKCVLSLTYSLWHPTNSIVPLLITRMVQDWPMESGCMVDFRKLYLLWCESIQSLHPLQQKLCTCRLQQCSGSTNSRRSRFKFTSSGYKRYIEHSPFTSLVLSGMGNKATTSYKCL